MQNNRNSFVQTYLYSIAGIIAMAVLLIAINLISSTFYRRADLTEDRIYTLSPGTRAILKDMDSAVTIRFYYSRDAKDIPMPLKNYAGRVEDILKEYQMLAPDNLLTVQKLNPIPDSDAEDSAALDGIQPQGGFMAEPLYFGIAVSALDQTAVIPVLSPQREALLEYDLTRAIYQVLHPEKPVLGILAGLPVMGGSSGQPAMPGMPPPQEPWIVVQELQRQFEVRPLPPQTSAVDKDIDVLLLIHPAEMTEQTMFAIDQFVLRGGKLLVFVDPMSVVARMSAPPQNPMMQQFAPPPQDASDLGPLFNAWGVQFNPDKVAADLRYMTTIRGQNGQPQDLPTILTLTGDAISRDDTATTQLNQILYVFGGIFSGTPAAGLEKTVLLTSSENVQAVDKFQAQMMADAIKKEFAPADGKQILAMRLAGNFKTAFPDGDPQQPAAQAENSAEVDQAVDENATPQGEALTSSTKPGVVVLVGDVDMLHDNFCVQRQQFFGQQIAAPINDNIALVQNLVEQLSGDANLISIRSRGRIHRPFEVVHDIQAEKEKEYQSRIGKLEDDLNETKRRINELQRQKSADQRAFVSPEQREEILKFRQKEARISQELKELRKEYRREIDALENTLKWINIGLMPALITLAGLALAVSKRRRSAKK